MGQESQEQNQEAQELYARFLADQEEEGGARESIEQLCARHPGHEQALLRLHAADRWLAPWFDEPTGSRAPALEIPSGLRAALTAMATREHPHERYEARAELEPKGGQGQLSLLWDRDLRRSVVQKRVLAEGAGRWGDEAFDARRAGRLLDEARITGGLEHPGIVPVHELGLTPEGELYFTMKQVVGRDLDVVFDECAKGEGELSRERVLGMLLRACEAVAFAHDRGVVHRDLKPENIRVGDFGEVYVIDWGLARTLDEADWLPLPVQPQSEESARWTLEGCTPGTRGYLAPERVRVDTELDERRCDVYSMGAVLHRWLTGRRVYHARGEPLDTDTYVARLKAGPAPLDELYRKAPAALAAICARALAYDPGRRYADMRELAADLAAFVDGRTVRAYRTGPLAELASWIRRHRALAAAILLALVGAFLGWRSLVDARAFAESEWQRYRAGLSAAYAYLLVRRPVEANEELREFREARSGFELEHLTAKLVGPESLVFAGHAAGVIQAEFGPTGEWAASVSREGSLCVWSTSDGHELFPALDQGEPLSSLAIDPGGEWIATGAASGRLRVVSARDGSAQPGFRDTLSSAAPSAGSSVRRMRFHPTDGSLWTLGMDSRLQIWDLATGAKLEVVQVADGQGLGLAISRDGARVATSAQDGGQGFPKVRVFDTSTLAELEHISMPSAIPGIALDFSLDGEALVIGSDVIQVWTLGTHKLRQVREHTKFIVSVRHTPSGGEFVTGSLDGSWRVWDASTLTELTSFGGHADEVRSVAVHPSGRSVLSASSDGTARVVTFDLEPGLRRLSSNPLPKGCLAISPDGALLVAGCDDNKIYLFDERREAAPVVLREHGDRVERVVFVGERELVSTSPDRTLRLWSLAGEPSSTVVVQLDAMLNDLVFDAASARLVGAGADGKLRIWSLADASSPDRWVAREQAVSESALTALEFSHDGGQLALGCADGGIRLLSMPDARERQRLPGGAREGDSRPRQIHDLLFLPDGALLSAGADGRLLRHALDGSASRTLLETRQALTSLLALSDGQRFACAGTDGAIRLWDSSRGELLLDMRGLTAGINQLASTPDGRELAAASDSGEVLILESAAPR